MPTDTGASPNEALDHARTLLKKGEFAPALEAVELVERQHPEHAAVVFLKGILKRRLGKPAEAQILLGPCRKGS